MLTVTLRNVGGSIMMAIPKALLDGLGMAANMQVGLLLDHGRLIVEPQIKPHYDLSELMAQCDLNAAPSTEEIAWYEMPPAGDEVL